MEPEQPIQGGPVAPPAPSPVPWTSPIAPPSSQPRQTRRLWIGLGVVLALALLLTCAVTAGISTFRAVTAGQQALQTILQRFMVAGQQQDATTGYSLFAPSAGVSQAQIAELFHTQQTIFANYQSVQLSQWRINSSNGDTNATVEGSVTSKGQGTPRFRAQLYNYQGQWRFVTFQFLTGVGP